MLRHTAEECRLRLKPSKAFDRVIERMRAKGIVDVEPDDLRDLWEIATFQGMFWLLSKYYTTAVEEAMSSLSKKYYLRRLQRLLPCIKEEDLLPRVPGIRAQAMRKDGSLADDFVIDQVGPWVNVLNAPSPAATACLGIAKHVVGLL